MPGSDNVCSHHEALMQRIDNMIETQEKLNGCMVRVDRALGEGKVNFATLGTRLSLVEKIVYGLAGATLLGVAAAVLALVLK